MKKILNQSIGFMIIELLLALTLSAFIVSSIMTLYLAVYKSFHLQSSLSYIQENAKITLETLNFDVRMAGYIGCGKLSKDFPLSNNTQYEFSVHTKITKHVNTYGDVLTIRRGSTSHALLIQTMENLSEIILTNTLNFSEGDVLIISNCKSADLFIVKSVVFHKNFTKLTSSRPLSYQYEKNAEVSFLHINTYFIDKTKRKTISKKPIYSLFKTEINKPKTELVEGVSTMQVSFHLNKHQQEQGVTFFFLFTSPYDFTKKWYNTVGLRENL